MRLDTWLVDEYGDTNIHEPMEYQIEPRVGDIIRYVLTDYVIVERRFGFSGIVTIKGVQK